MFLFCFGVVFLCFVVVVVVENQPNKITAGALTYRIVVSRYMLILTGKIPKITG